MQHKSIDAGTTTTASLTFSTANAAGNWIAVCIRAGNSSSQVFTVKDSLGNTYHQAVQIGQTVSQNTLSIFYAENVKGGSNTVTVSDTVSAILRFAILEYSGVATANSLDVFAAAQGSSASPNSGTATTTASGDLLLGAIITFNSGNFTAGSNYTIEERVPAEPNTKLIVEDQIQITPATASAGASLAVSDNWAAALAEFKPAGGVAGSPATITATAGTPQSATINTPFGIQLQATVKDPFNNPVGGATVFFTAPGSGASGTFAGGVTTATTNPSGVATAAIFTANTTAGAYTVTATASGISTPANFSLTNLAGGAASIVATAGTPQSAPINAAFGTQLQATVKDSFNNAVSGVTVTFAAPTNGASGTFAGGVTTATTNAQGVATAAVFTANGTAGGPYTLTATVSGVTSPANFSLTNLAASPAIITSTAGTPQSATVNTAFASQLQATVKDASSNPVSGVTVTFTAPTSGASGAFAGGVNTATTNSLGVATSAVFTANSIAGGPYNVAALVSGVSAPANFSLTNVAGAPANIAATAGTPQSTAVNTAFAAQLQVAVKDSLNNPTSGVTVTFTAPTSGASGTFAGGVNTATTNALGLVTAPVFTANSTAGGPYTVTATVSGVATLATFSLTNLAGAAASIAPTAGTPQSAVINTAFGTPLQAIVTDSQSNPVSGVPVTFTAPASGSSGTFGAIAQTVNVYTDFENGLDGQALTVSALTAATVCNGAGGSWKLVGNASTQMQLAAAAEHSLLTSIQACGTTFTPSGSLGVTYNLNNSAVGSAQYTWAATSNNASAGIWVKVGVPTTDTNYHSMFAISDGTGDFVSMMIHNGQIYLESGANPNGNPNVGTKFNYTANVWYWVTEQFQTYVNSNSMHSLNIYDASGNLLSAQRKFSATYGTVKPFYIAVGKIGDTGIPSVLISYDEFLADTTGATFPILPGGASPANTVTTNTQGVATAAAFTANGTVGGPYNVTASVPGISTPANFSLTNVAGSGSASIIATAGTPQSATVNTAFSIQLQATVKDSFNNPVSGATVTFSAPGGGASGMFAGGLNTATTNASGVATAAAFNANATAGTYTVTASAPGISSPASFSLTNLAGPAAAITGSGGTSQSATVSTAFTTQLQATIKDSFGNPVSGVLVAFTAPTSGPSGTFAGGLNTATTNASGIATAPVFTANTTAGGPYIVAASVAGVSAPANFSLTNLAGAATNISATAGTPQSAAVNTAFATQLQATIQDSFGNPVSGVLVAFSAPASGPSGTFAGNVKTATSSVSGVATAAAFTANTAAGGPYIVTASTSGVSTPANFSLTNLTGAPTNITATAGTPQSAVIGTPFATQLQVTIKDSFGNPVSGVLVTFSAPTSGPSGTFAAGTNAASTNTSGVAIAPVFTANSLAGGPYTVIASASGIATSANFSLTNLGNPPANIAPSAGTPQSATINTPFAMQLQVTVTDSNSNPVSGVTVTFTAPPSGPSGTFAGGVNTAATNASGVAASAVFTANSVVGGPYFVTATVSGVATPANFSLTNLTGVAATITATAGTPQSATINFPFGTQLQAMVTDVGNNPVGGVIVTFTAPGSGAGGTFSGGVSTATTNSLGVAAAAVFTANTTAGAYTVAASASGVSTPANFSLTNLAGGAASISATAGTPQSATVSNAFAVQLQATVKDSFNNPVSGATVTFTPPASGASGTFAGGVNTATTNTQGQATAPIFTANSTAGGPYSVAATVSGAANPVYFSLTNVTPSLITLVQHKSIDAGTATTASLTFSTTNTTGNWIAVCIRAGNSSSQVFTVKDSNGNTYHQAVQFGQTVSQNTLGIFYAENIKGGANTITVSDTVSGILRFAILEYSGVATANSLDVFAAAQGSSALPGSGPVTTTARGDLLLGTIITFNSGNFTAGSNYTIEERVPAEPNTKLIVEDQIQQTAGTASAGASVVVSDNWAAGLAAFKAASGAASTGPSITSLSQTAGAAGTPIMITGTGFGTSQGTSTIAFNGTAATPTNWTATGITAPVPTSATTGNIVVTVGGAMSNGAPFTVVSGPFISNLNPTSGRVGVSVTITGANFGSSQGSSTVTFNGTAASPTSWGDTNIVAPVPAGATTGNVIVAVGGVSSNGASFTVTGGPAYGLSVSISMDRSFASGLQGAAVEGFNYVFTSPASQVANSRPSGISSVSFWLDNTAMTGSPNFTVSGSGPYDFAGSSSGNANPWNTAPLADGAHTITQLVSTTNGQMETDTATFTVQNTLSTTITSGRYEYVVTDQNMYVYSLDNNFQLAKHVTIPQVNGVRGIGFVPATHMLYVAYGGNGGSTGTGSLLKYDLVADSIVWTQSYSFGVDSFSITPDGTTIYMPDGANSGDGFWYIIDASTGNVLGNINTGMTGPHNTIVSLDGVDVFMAPRFSADLVETAVATNTVALNIGPLNQNVRPFTINGKHTLAFTTSDTDGGAGLGFQVGDTSTGQVLFSVSVPGFSVSSSFPNTPCHGISLSPDEKEIYLIDVANLYVHIFDVTGLPSSAPALVASVPLTTDFNGLESPCLSTFSCQREGWLRHTRDGHYVLVGDSGNVVDTITRQVVGTIPQLLNTRKGNIEIDWQNGLPVSTTSHYGIGYVIQ